MCKLHVNRRMLLYFERDAKIVASHGHQILNRLQRFQIPRVKYGVL